MNTKPLVDRLDAAGWGLFLLWVGFAFLAEIDFGVGLVGVGVITLGMQVLRQALGVRVEGFWLVVGGLFLLGGVWEIYEVQYDLGPLVLIGVGLALLFGAIRGGRREPS